LSRTGGSPTWIARYLSAAAFAITLAAASFTWPGSSVRAGDPLSVSSAVAAAPLDGRTFRARIVRAGAEEDGPLGDELTFSDGRFSSAICKQYNFAEAPYWVRLEGDRIHFLAELTSPTDGRMLWKGTVEGDTLEGTMHWTKKRWYWTIDTEHQIRGELETRLADPAAN
jgi:hypothetical protein